MKVFILIISLLICRMSLAIPVVNENAANSGVITIYPDNISSHRFYIAPNVVMITKGEDGVPIFSYVEYRHDFFSVAGIVQMTLVPAYTREELEAAEAQILKKDPLAEFSGVPFIESKLELTGELQDLIEENQCNHQGGLIGQEEACSLLLTSKGRALFYKALKSKTIFTTLQFQYSIQAVVRKADGSFADQLLIHGIAVRIDGDQLANYPQLIHRL
jgi:hypothetical protein